MADEVIEDYTSENAEFAGGGGREVDAPRYLLLLFYGGWRNWNMGDKAARAMVDQRCCGVSSRWRWCEEGGFSEGRRWEVKRECASLFDCFS